MNYTYNPGMSDRDYVRLLIGDVDMTQPIFADEELDSYLTNALGNDPRWAAASALDTMAVVEAYMTKAIKALDLMTRGDLVAAQFAAQAAKLRDQYEQDPGAFDVAEMPDGDFAQRERLEDEFLRRLA